MPPPPPLDKQNKKNWAKAEQVVNNYNHMKIQAAVGSYKSATEDQKLQILAMIISFVRILEQDTWLSQITLM